MIPPMTAAMDVCRRFALVGSNNQIGYICLDATPNYAVWHEIGIQDIAAIIVTIAVIDKQGLIYVKSRGMRLEECRGTISRTMSRRPRPQRHGRSCLSFSIRQGRRAGPTLFTSRQCSEQDHRWQLAKYRSPWCRRFAFISGIFISTVFRDRLPMKHRFFPADPIFRGIGPAHCPRVSPAVDHPDRRLSFPRHL